MLFWRIWGALLGASLVIGETIRSWGQGRNPLFVVDDFLIGIPLLITAWMMGRPSAARLAAFAAAFGATAGMLYSSFFGKVVELSADASASESFASNIEGNFLTVLIGMAFVGSLAGLVASIALAERALRPSSPP